MPGRTKSRAVAQEDTNMEDVPPSAQKPEATPDEADTMQQEGAEEEEEEEVVEQRVRILPGSTSTAASFEFLEEGHTMGNALRYIIMKNPEVEFCAYAIPHPSEAKMNIRIQTYDTTTATAALAKGLKDLEDLCDVVAEKFWTERNAFVAASADKMEESS
ncbi:DNA-directed RNA polymerase [Xylariales sp. PMI_506]|nr:DNA-directed RNA polymerase [Xylariales sp. PMI_506]